MGEIRLDYCCRLCLKEGFSLTNIFSHRSAAGDPLYRILNYIYGIKVFKNDGLPSQICSPCMWRMIEFDACKKNVRSAETEIMRLLNQIRPQSSKVSNDGAVMIAEGTQMDESSEVGIERSPVHSEVSIRDELDAEEWEMPVETIMKISDKSELKGSPYLEGNHNTADYSSVESRCISSSPGIIMEVDINRGMPDKDVQDEVVSEDSALALEAESRNNVAELEFSGSNIPINDKKHCHICDICEKSFPSKWKLDRHVRIHFDERPFSCGVCGQGFKQDNARRVHELMHLRDSSDKKSEVGNNQKPYACDICEKDFSSKSALNRHYNLHNQKYSCSSCGKNFGSNALLEVHSRIHTKERPFKCELCDKCFNRKSNLEQHMASHSADRPFPCAICDKKFKLKQIRDRHELHHLSKN